MPEDDTGADRKDVELVKAVERLMAFRRQALRDPEDIIDLATPYSHRGGYSSGDRRLVQLCLDDPLWHFVEEAMKKSLPLAQKGSLSEGKTSR